jgi:subtilisin family serine protease
VRLAGTVTILNISKWLNSVTIQTTDAAALAKINGFSFVQTSSPIAARMASDRNKFEQEQIQKPSVSHKETGIASDFFDYGSSFAQIHIHNGEFLHNIGLRGEGMQIGMLDAGFQNYLTVRAFDSARANGQFLGTWDFVAKETSVNEDNPHGMQCLSTIAANIPGQFVGTAPKASFYLFRSEDASSEYPIEEHNWVCAAERVDSAGGDMISSSLGYNSFDAPLATQSHTYADMDGNTTMAAIGADLAAKKGILVMNSAGNEGGNSWGKIITPADGDSVMAVGAVNASGIPAGFTSRGPSSDGQVKPDVASVGVATVVQLQNNTIGTNNGTSFSAPNMAGLTACLWQGFQEFTNIKIINALQRAGSRATILLATAYQM